MVVIEFSPKRFQVSWYGSTNRNSYIFNYLTSNRSPTPLQLHLYNLGFCNNYKYPTLSRFFFLSGISVLLNSEGRKDDLRFVTISFIAVTFT